MYSKNYFTWCSLFGHHFIIFLIINIIVVVVVIIFPDVQVLPCLDV